MPYTCIEDARIAARKRRARQREQTKAVSPHMHHATTIGKRASSSQLKGSAKGGRANELKAYIPAPITLPTINAPTLAEIEAKYGELQ